jgi:hypothetical protein
VNSCPILLNPAKKHSRWQKADFPLDPSLKEFQVRQKIALLFILSLPSLALADTFTYSYIFGEKKVGHLTAETRGDQTTIDYDVKNNGRGEAVAGCLRAARSGQV